MTNSNTSVLDLTGRTPLSPENAKHLNQLALDLRPHIVDLIDQISYPQLANIDWWVTPLASKNPFSSTLFLNCCRIALLEKLLQERQVPAIVWVGSPAMAKLASYLADKHDIRLCIRCARGAYLSELLWTPIKNLLAVFFHVFMQLLSVKLMLPSPKPFDDTGLVIIDTFLYKTSIQGGKFYDRHFPGLVNFLGEKNLGGVLFFPTFYKIRNYPKIFFKLRTLRGQFIFKEHYLRVVDYLYALGHGFRFMGIYLDDHIAINGLPIRSIILEELHRGWMRPSAIEALLKFRAIKRISIAGAKISRVLDWFENQDIDRGANAGYRRCYPNIEVVGYIGYVASEHYLCMYPSQAEMLAKVLPTKFAVIRKDFIEDLKEFCPSLNVEISPALRYEKVTPGICRDWLPGEVTILVALPVVKSEAFRVINAISQLVDGFSDEYLASSKVKIIVKPHPASNPISKTGLRIGGNEKINVTWSIDKLDKLLFKSDVLVSSASSACFEALMMGVPTIIIGSNTGLTYAPIPKSIPKDLWQICYSWQEVMSTILNFQIKKDVLNGFRASADKDLWEEYLEVATIDGILRLVFGGDADLLKAKP